MEEDLGVGEDGRAARGGKAKGPGCDRRRPRLPMGNAVTMHHKHTPIKQKKRKRKTSGGFYMVESKWMFQFLKFMIVNRP